MASTEGASPEEAFAALGNENRVQILRAFADAESSEQRTLRFSELYDRVDIDGTNQLAYHLDRLEGIFLRRDDRGYSFTHAGDRVVREILSESYNRAAAFEETVVEGYCPTCGSRRLRARYRNPLLAVSCIECENSVVTYDVAPGHVDTESSEDVLRACDRRVHYEYGAALDGVCPECGGSTAVDIEHRDSAHPESYYAVATCRTCERCIYAPLSFRLLYDPGVCALYWDHGVDLTRVPFYRVTEHVTGWELTVEPTEPLEVAFTVAVGGDELSVRVTDDLDVTPA
ncbi:MULTISPECIES: winged helix-turn-helix domain-containing protein [Halorussus]|uniref:winged helix-turn-helix domain-containing protein n=1 Tax=Halorussus TaxID=1070314 RepID=UPI000E2167F1|nr:MULTISPECIES: winged helix-turn-helix domain-containing protein [Halorussus]NHN58951.1 helix-turn-helix transcriptional regulator [Halorussus sp. JP-T4]